MSEQKSSERLKWFAAIVLLGFVGYQLYSGIALRKVGVPGVFEVEFATDGGPSCSTLDQSAFDNVVRATNMDREAIAQGDYPTSKLAKLEYYYSLIAELERKGHDADDLDGLELRELVVRARRECIIP